MALWFTIRSMTRKPLVWAGCGALMVAGVGAWAYDDAPADVGLNGIIAPFAPEDLEPEKLDEIVGTLDDSWKEWGAETSQLITDFYEGEHPSIESQREILGKLQVKLETMRSSLEDSRFQSVHDEVRELYGRLAPRVEIASAVLDTLTIDPVAARQARLSESLTQLNKSVAGVRNTLSKYRNGDLWVEWTRLNDLGRIAGGSDVSVEDGEIIAAIAGKLEHRGDYADEMRDFVSQESFLALEDALRSVHGNLADPGAKGQEQRAFLAELVEALDAFDANPDALLAQQIREKFKAASQASVDGGERIQEALVAYYLNYNVRMLISEGLLQRAVREDRNESSWVNECIMNAHVTGWQCTSATVTADIQPSSEGAKVLLKLSGNVQANTSGSVPAATVYSVGYHTFNASKTIIFDGHNFALDPTRVAASANNQVVDAETKYSGVPLIGPIAKSIAMNKADGMIGQANSYTIDKMRTEVASQLDEQASTQFANASMELENKVYGPLREYSLYPDAMQISSTDSHIRAQARVLGSDELGGSRPAPGVQVPANGMVVQLHESAMSNSAERFELAGKTMTENEIKDLLQERLSKILGREVKLPEPTGGEGERKNETIVFDQDEAIRFVVEGGEVKIILRAGLKRENQDIPPQKITVPLSFQPNGDEVIMKRGQVRVEPIPGQAPANVAEQVARSRIMISKIEGAIPEKTFENKLEFKQQEKVLNLKITSINAQGGWLTIAAE